MEMLDYKYMINRLTDKHDSSLKFILFFKTLFPKNMTLYYIYSFIHILGLLIISNSFIISQHSTGFKLAEAFRKLTSFYILGNISENSYEIISFIIIIMISIYLLLLGRLYNNIKNIENYICEDKSIFIKIVQIMTVCLMILSQHLKEFLTFSIIMYCQIGNNVEYQVFSNSGTIYIVAINCVCFILFNIFEYFLKTL